MKKQSRKTEFWEVPTPARVGPGSYEVSQLKKFRYNSAPFSKAEVKLTGQKIALSTLPGPGSYDSSLEWVKNYSPSSNFLSNLPRTGQIPQGSLNLIQWSPTETPGPGHYNTDTQVHKMPSKKYRQLSMIVESTVASIPYKPGQGQHLGPTSYNPDMSLIKPKTLGTSFAASKSKRNMFDSKVSNLGPGKYVINADNRTKKQSWVFTSKVEKKTEVNAEQVPGPGSYDPKDYKRQPRVLVEGFGSTTERDILLTNDPHRPYANIDHSMMHASTDSYQDSSKQEFFRKKYLNPKTSIRKPGFGSSEKRESEWANMNTIVGPGDYSANPITTHKSKFMPKSSRFGEYKISLIPGPGEYEPIKNQKIAAYINQAPRFKEDKRESPEVYISHQPWKVKQNRAYDAQTIEPNLKRIKFIV